MGDIPIQIGGFVGRERELAELRHALDETREGRGRLFLISGEPGIGKTRLTEEVAREAAAREMRVLWGRCWEGAGAPAYWPWIQVIRGFLGTLDPQQRTNLAVESEIASEVIRQVAQIVPDLRPAPMTPSPLVSDKLEPSEARFRLFDAVTNFLKIGARSHPMLIVLDDLHDADEASAALLRFVARELRGAAILIVASYREAEVRRSPTLSKLVGELSREASSIPVGGMNESEVAKLVELRAGQKPDDKLVAKLCAATNGNPLFVDGIVRMLLADGAIQSAGELDYPFKISGGIREAVRIRLNAVSPDSMALLAVASAIGNEFEFTLCHSAAEVSADQAHRLLDETASAGIVTALGHSRYRFSHALVRGVVYDELESNRRILIHGKIANRMEEFYRENIDSHLAELAYHFREAGVSEKAIDYSVRAGEASAEVLAFTDAMAHSQAALDLVERQGVDALRRADLLTWRARISFNVDRAASIKCGESAIALYEGIGRFDKAADAHIQLGTVFHMRGDPLFNASLAREHLGRAESILGNGPETVSVADLYHMIGANESHQLNLTVAARASRRSMEISDRLEHKSFWPSAAAFYALSLIMEGRLDEGFALYDRAFDAAVKANVPCMAAAWGAGMFNNFLGDPQRGRECYERELKRIRIEAAPVYHRELSFMVDYSYYHEGRMLELQRRLGSEDWAVRFWIGGEWEAIGALNEDLAKVCERTGNPLLGLDCSLAAGVVYGFYLGDHARGIANLKYRLDNGDGGRLVLWEMRARPWLAHLYVAMNRLDNAAKQIAICYQIMADGEDWRALSGYVVAADAVVAAARGNYDFAFRQFEAALAIHRKYHLGREEADTLQFWGRALAAGGDRTIAGERFDAAIEISRARGVGPRFLEWLTADKMRALGGTSPSRRQPESKVTGSFRKEGEFWTISYQAATFRLKDAKGLHYIGYLLARPGQRIHVHDLIEAVEGSPANGKTIHADSEDLQIVREIGGPAPTIDARARSEYRTRLRDLQAELDDAERMNDLGRSDRLRTEIEMVGDELTGSSGLGGRARMTSASAERARGLVGKNIRSAMEKIRREHPALRHHFATAITLGYFCAYQPDPEHAISWQL